MTATAAFAQFAVEYPDSAFPADVRAAARRAVLDTIGVALAGTVEPAGRIIVAQAREQGGQQESVIWGTDAKVNAQNAALANGTTAHVLDFDDTNDSMRGHPSVPVLPAVFAVGERLGVSGSSMLNAFVIGVEVECKLGRFTGQAPYDHGWHVTSTHGVIGATAGVGRLAGLNVDQMRYAIGIAVSQAAGVRQNFGTMTKSFHVGRAAQSAVLAVDLVQKGFTASRTSIEDEFGYWRVLGRDQRSAGHECEVSLGNPFDLVQPGINVKAYPCCASTHAAIDAAVSVSDGLSLDQIERVVVHVPYTAPLILIHHRPEEPLAAKFSLEYCVAAALLDGNVTLAHFTPSTIERQDLQTLLRRVEYVVPEEWQPPRGEGKTGCARIDVYFRNGTVRRAETTGVRGSPAYPLSEEDLEQKFLACAQIALGEDGARDALTCIRDIECVGAIRELSRMLAGRDASRLEATRPAQ